MKINYEFVDGNKVEIEVSEEWAEIVIELDDKERSNDRKETRNHTSFNSVESICKSNEVGWPDFYVCDEGKRAEISISVLVEMIKQLTPKQRDLIYNIYFLGLSARDYAKKREIKECTVSITHKAALKKMKKFFKQNY